MMTTTMSPAAATGARIGVINLQGQAMMPPIDNAFRKADTVLDEIHAAFERTGTLESGRLGPAHQALDGRFDYGILKCVLAELA